MRQKDGMASWHIPLATFLLLCRQYRADL